MSVYPNALTNPLIQVYIIKARTTTNAAYKVSCAIIEFTDTPVDPSVNGVDRSCACQSQDRLASNIIGAATPGRGIVRLQHQEGDADVQPKQEYDAPEYMQDTCQVLVGLWMRIRVWQV